MMSHGEGHGLSWEDGNVPVSELFDDTFYSRHDGQAESAYVFIDGNGLPERWADQPHFAVAELGFGTGLNFLETWRVWVKTRRHGQKLTFTSFERYPLGVDDMARALVSWRHLDDLVGVLLKVWSSNEPGAYWQMDAFTQLRVVIGDAEASVGCWDGMADAWYLDGFSPAKNPEMWEAPLLRSVFEHTALGGSFATYTAAGWVRRNLEAAGFDVHKRPGHGGKREMMLGQRSAI